LREHKMLAMNPWEIVIPGLAAVGVPAWAALHPRSQLFGTTICNMGKACALTFDDGPNPRVTPQLIVLLEKHRVPATFFVIGKYVEQHRGLTAELAAAGHSIGNHTYGHPSLLFFGRRQIMDELKRCNDAICEATGRETSSVRPPFGFRGPQFYSAAREVGLSKIVMWSVTDWSPWHTARVSDRIRKVKPGDIALLHDGHHRIADIDRSDMLQALKDWLPRWQDSGLEFVKIV
jgi:peptidoglycan/xylan/chitin deacetylase (PgdA/CDA1 family)